MRVESRKSSIAAVAVFVLVVCSPDRSDGFRLWSRLNRRLRGAKRASLMESPAVVKDPMLEEEHGHLQITDLDRLDVRVIATLPRQDTPDVTAAPVPDPAALKEKDDGINLTKNKPRRRFCFEGQSEIRTDPVQLRRKSKKELIEFFRSNRDVLVKKGAYTRLDNYPAFDEESIERRPQHQQPTKDGCKTLLDRDVLLLTSSMPMIGLNIQSSTVLCTELLLDHHSQLPEYRLTLLESSLDATGPGAKLFTQIKDRIRTSSQTKIQCLPDGVDSDHDDDKISLLSRGYLRVEVDNLPAKTPGTSIVERQGNQILSRFVQQESKRGLDKFQGALLDWIANSTTN